MDTRLGDPRIIEFDVRTDEMLVNMGPQHPSTHGVLRLVLRTDGEVVSEVEPHIGYLHRCAEKIGENLTPRQWIPYTDRMDYLAAMNMNLGWALTVEKLMGLELPDKAKHLRVIIAEMNRIASHLVGMGAYGLDLGTFSPFLYAFREREKILDLFEEVCGARLTYSYITVGGATSAEGARSATTPPSTGAAFASAGGTAGTSRIAGSTGGGVAALPPVAHASSNGPPRPRSARTLAASRASGRASVMLILASSASAKRRRRSSTRGSKPSALPTSARSRTTSAGSGRL